MNTRPSYTNSLTVQRKVYQPKPYREYHVNTGMEILKAAVYVAGALFIAAAVYFLMGI